ncbi:Short chain dehydrogenase atnD [Fusarium oxysporum f. sp. cubense]|uniref:Short chain dehydrogenase atnD n=1 Tax=Fusarium oxysporum f. sp. cubense TaxID=61366 RepID=A0A559KSR8_FUSOC|nr:Short chain dehydrogenase atnD [Fusarium oxysporum f. sp. cubense]
MSIASSIYGISSTIYSNLFINLPYPETKDDLSDKIMIVTGSNTGLGFEASQHLLRLGVGKLIMAVRSLDKGEKARKELLQLTKRSPDSVEVWHLDMASYESVKSFAARAIAELPTIDVVLANAGLATSDEFSMAEDNERTITVNVISTFLLFFILLPKVQKSSYPGKFVIPNSATHYWAPIKELIPDEKAGKIFSRLNNPEKSIMESRYYVSKLIVLYITREIAARLTASEKSSVIINAPNPSYCKSGLLREKQEVAPPDFMARTSEMGSRALVAGVLAGQESNGQYMNNCQVRDPACHVTNKTGGKIQTALFEELLEKLENIAPGVSKNM